MPSTLSATVRAEYPIHTARHTATLHMTALANTVSQSGATLPAATDTIGIPHGAAVHGAHVRDAKTSATTRSDPARLPRPHDRPIAQKAAKPDLSRQKRDDHEVVAREQLRNRYNV